MIVKISCYRLGNFIADLPEGETIDSLMDDTRGLVKLACYDSQGERVSQVTVRRRLIDSVEEEA